MAADVVETAELKVGSANDEQRLADELSGEVVAWLCDLIVVSDDLPSAGEDFLFFLGCCGGIDVETCGKSPSASDVGIDVLEVQ